MTHQIASMHPILKGALFGQVDLIDFSGPAWQVRHCCCSLACPGKIESMHTHPTGSAHDRCREWTTGLPL